MNATTAIQRVSVRTAAPVLTLTVPSTVTAQRALWASAAACGPLSSPTCRQVMLWSAKRSWSALPWFFLSSSPSSSSSLLSARRFSRRTTRGTTFLWSRTQPLRPSLTKPMAFSLRHYIAHQETPWTCMQSRGLGPSWDLHRFLCGPWHTHPVSKETHVPRWRRWWTGVVWSIQRWAPFTQSHPGSCQEPPGGEWWCAVWPPTCRQCRPVVQTVTPYARAHGTAMRVSVCVSLQDKVKASV